MWFSARDSVVGGSGADPRNNPRASSAAGLAAGTVVVSICVVATNIAGQADPAVAGLNQDFALVAYNAAPCARSRLLSLNAVSRRLHGRRRHRTE